MIDRKLDTHLPQAVTLIEVGPRDGFQREKKIIPTELKVEIIAGLVEAGFRQIQVTAFVHPGRIPQLADAEQLLAALPNGPNIRYNALVLNTRGLERALRTGIESVEISVSASDTHSRKNMGQGRKQALAQALTMIGLAKKHGLHVRAGIQCVFGCAYEGPVPPARGIEMARAYMTAGCDLLAIADTTGMATPPMIERFLKALMPATIPVPVVMHLHNTHGLALANVHAAMACGVTRFDTALGGLGGCPFVPGASGNIATENAVRMMNRMNIDTGIDIARVAKCTERIRSFLAQ